MEVRIFSGQIRSVATKNTSDLGPQMVVKSKGNLLFQGNLQ